MKEKVLILTFILFVQNVIAQSNNSFIGILLDGEVKTENTITYAKEFDVYTFSNDAKFFVKSKSAKLCIIDQFGNDTIVTFNKQFNVATLKNNLRNTIVIDSTIFLVKDFLKMLDTTNYPSSILFNKIKKQYNFGCAVVRCPRSFCFPYNGVNVYTREIKYINKPMLTLDEDYDVAKNITHVDVFNLYTEKVVSMEIESLLNYKLPFTSIVSKDEDMVVYLSNFCGSCGCINDDGFYIKFISEKSFNAKVNHIYNYKYLTSFVKGIRLLNLGLIEDAMLEFDKFYKIHGNLNAYHRIYQRLTRQLLFEKKAYFDAEAYDLMHKK